MADLEVIYDPAKELACIINVDERVGWGPAMIGPNAGTILQAFIDTTPFDVSEMGTYDAARAFNGFLDRVAARGETTAAAPDQGTVEPAQPAGVANEPVATTEHGAPTDEPPAPAPADTDPTVEADTSQTVAVTDTANVAPSPQTAQPPPTVQQKCVLCDGTGTVQTDPTQPAAPCGMCQGSGVVTVAAQP